MKVRLASESATSLRAPGVVSLPPQEPAAAATLAVPKQESRPADDFDAATEEIFAAVTEVESLFSGPSNAAFRTRTGGNISDPESPFAKGLRAFETADYRQAVGWFAQVDSTKNPNLAIAAIYMQGHSRFRMQEYEEAANAFRFVFQQNRTLYTKDAKWKEALCLYAAFGAELRRNLVVLSACQSGTGSCGKYYDRLRESLRWTVNNYPAQAQKAAQLLERLEK